MIKKLIIFIVVVLVGALVLVAVDRGFFGMRDAGEALPPDGSTQTTGQSVVAAGITYTDAGFESSTITVKAGTTVVFMNQASRPVWPASAMHPTHKVYPGSDIEKCGTVEADKIFDACAGIAPGGEWSFTFNEIGTWKYHDHLNVSKFGTIVVE